MTWPTATQLTAGTMSYADVDGIFTLYRDFLNDIPLADVAGGAAHEQHLVRPRVDGFPINGIRANRRIVQACQYGLNVGSARTNAEWAARSERLIIKPFLLPQGDVWLLPLGFRVQLPASAEVTIDAAWEYLIRTQLVAGNGPTYPQSTNGTPTSDAGYFALFTQRRFDASGNIVTGRFTEQTETMNPVYPAHGDAMDFGDDGVHRCHFPAHILWNQTLAAGTWDLWVGFRGRSTRVDGFNQLDVSAFSATLEATM